MRQVVGFYACCIAYIYEKFTRLLFILIMDGYRTFPDESTEMAECDNKLGGLSEADGKAPKQDERSMLYKVLKTINIVIVWMAIVSISVVFNIVDMH